MDSALERLMSLVKKESVSMEEAREGIISCFCVVNRAYMRNGAMEIGEDTSDGMIDRMMRLLVAEVSSGLGIARNATIGDLNALKAALDEKLEFAAKDPAIMQKHEEVIGKLLELCKAGAR